MTQQLQAVLNAAHELPMHDKLELLQSLHRDIPLDAAATAGAWQFWACPTVDELSAIQATPVATDLSSLVADFWPEDESADDFNQFVAEQRRADPLYKS